MAQAIAKYSRVLLKRLLWPLQPFSPLLRLIKVWHLIVVLLGLNLVGQFWPNPKISAVENLSRWPWSGYWHSQMALIYFQLGDEPAAINELNWAGSHRNNAEEVIRKPGLIRQDIGQWEKALETKKYSIDLLLKLALLNLTIYQDETGKNYFEQARYLDPTNESVTKLGEIISSLR
jgi:tetratricopeptide (TPR) repeat protein